MTRIIVYWGFEHAVGGFRNLRTITCFSASYHEYFPNTSKVNTIVLQGPCVYVVFWGPDVYGSTVEALVASPQGRNGL